MKNIALKLIATLFFITISSHASSKEITFKEQYKSILNDACHVDQEDERLRQWDCISEKTNKLLQYKSYLDKNITAFLSAHELDNSTYKKANETWAVYQTSFKRFSDTFHSQGTSATTFKLQTEQELIKKHIEMQLYMLDNFYEIQPLKY